MSQPSPTSPLTQARADDSARRRRRVLKALDDLASDGQPISVSAVARLAGVHRSLIYRHSDLHAAVLTRAAQPLEGPAGPQVSRQSLLADLANLTERNTRLAKHITQLERKLSETLGHDAWRSSGLGASADVDALHQRIAQLEQELAEFKTRVEERDEDLAAARATNRELMSQLNSPRNPR